MDGWGIVEADEIRLFDDVNSATVATVDYESNTITVTRELDFQQGQKVSLAYNGSAPDLGAYELD